MFNFFFLYVQKYDTIPGMKGKIFLPLLVMMFGLAACQTASNNEVVESEIVSECVGANCAIVRYSAPNGNDLVLETDRHIIEIAAQPGTQYSYYVWAGDKDMSDDPDMIVQDGNAMVLTQE